jgi:hypothetical protein
VEPGGRVGRNPEKKEAVTRAVKGEEGLLETSKVVDKGTGYHPSIQEWMLKYEEDEEATTQVADCRQDEEAKTRTADRMKRPKPRLQTG